MSNQAPWCFLEVQGFPADDMFFSITKVTGSSPSRSNSYTEGYECASLDASRSSFAGLWSTTERRRIGSNRRSWRHAVVQSEKRRPFRSFRLATKKTAGRRLAGGGVADSQDVLPLSFFLKPDKRERVALSTAKVRFPPFPFFFCVVLACKHTVLFQQAWMTYEKDN